MGKRPWRRFDWMLLGALLLLSAYGVIMIYSATIDTLGVGDPVQRQLLYLGVGVVLLLLVASVDYRLLEILQHPFSFLTPLVLWLLNIAAVAAWQLERTDATAFTASQLAPFLPPLAIGLVLVLFVFAIDRVWLAQSEPVPGRLVLNGNPFRGLVIVGVLAVAGIGTLLVVRLGPARLPSLAPYLFGVGLSVLYLLDCLTLRITDLFRNLLYVVMVVLLAAVFELGQISGGAQSWLGAGAVQPSEIAKILIIVVLAKFLSDREERMEEIGTVLTTLGMIAAPILLIYLQPDLGTATVFIAIWVAMMWTAGMRFRHWFILAAGAAAALPLVWFALQDYMRERLLLFLNPAANPDSYFNIHQALVSIGSGGLIGKGLTHGTQSQLHFLRVRHTDFIFAVAAEELGFLGAVLIIGLLFFILWRILRIAERSRDTFGRLIAAGVAAIVLFQAAINVGMNLGLLPVTGLPLPFVSYGGSSLVTLMIGMGLVESVAVRHKKLEFD
ncbi:MAG: rod shape-determining protein RodA [Anaerolineae bacterium]|nr:rod shape-determining protein RodA [Anaerolineae bacterium]